MTLALLGGSLLLCACYVATEAVRRSAIRRRLLDIPNARSSHSTPVPRGGGIVIVLVTLAAGAAVGLARGTGPALLAYLACGLLIAGIGLADDLRSLPSGIRLAAQSVAALVLLAAAGWWREAELPLLGVVELGPLGPVLALLWIVGLTNAFNFMDGIDGLAGIQALVAGSGWAAAAWLGGQPLPAAIAAAAAIGSAAFLLHNWAPARIFMGDVGSAFLGFTFAALPFLLEGSTGPAGSALRVPFAAALALWPFVFDALYTFLRRLLRGEPVLAAHRSHLYQRMVIAGASHARVALLYGTLAVGGSLLATVWLLAAPGAAAVVGLSLPLLCLLLIADARAREARARAAGNLHG